jgi:DNA/RNA non-specific endonuclease
VSGAGQFDYARLKRLFERGLTDVGALGELLSGGWADAYRAACNTPVELVEVEQDELTYLFDIAMQRVVGVYGKPKPPADAYPSTRMRGFPLPADETSRLIRGHLVAHSLGGGTDINLIPQNRRLNMSGGWRRLERLAQRRPDAFVAVAAIYDDASQTPARLAYVVAVDGVLEYEIFENA